MWSAALESCVAGEGPAARCQAPGSCRPAACTVFRSSTVVVTGPTPPGTGDSAPAIPWTLSASNVPGDLPRFVGGRPHVHDGGTRPDVLTAEEPGPADRRDEHIGLPRDRGQVAGAGVADRDGGVPGQQELRHRLPDHHAPPGNNRTGPAERHVVGVQQFHDRGGGGGREGRQAAHEASRAERADAVHVLHERDGRYQRVPVHPGGQGGLQDDAVDRTVGCQPGQCTAQRGLVRIGAEIDEVHQDAGLAGCLLDRARIPRRGLVAGRHHDRQGRHDTALPQHRDIGAHPGADFCGYLLSVQHGGHDCSFSRTAMAMRSAVPRAGSSSLMT